MSTVTGAFDDYGVAAQVVEDLKGAGIDSSRISVFGSRQRDAQTFRDDVYPEDSLAFLMQSVISGAAIGIVVALGSTVILHTATNLFVGLYAAVSGACAGGYVGLMLGAVTRGDVAERADEIHESNMTRGKIWVGVEAEREREELESQKIMQKLGAIEVDPPLMDEQDRREKLVFTLSWLSSVVFVIAMFGMSYLSAYHLSDPTPAYRAALAVCFGGILLASIFTSIAGLHTRGAQKWLNMEKKADHDVAIETTTVS